MADLLTVKETDYVAIDSITNELLEVDGDRVSILEQMPQIIEARSTSVELVIINDVQTIIEVSEPLSYVSDTGGGGASGIDIYDEGTLIAKGVTELNLIGNLVAAKNNQHGRVSVFIPQPSYLSHFNTKDGLNDCTVTDAITFNRIISLPTSEGVPFSIGDWSSDQIHQVTPSGMLIYQPSSPCSFFDNSSTFTITIFDTDGTSTLYSFATSAISANGVFSSPNNAITINISGWSEDVDKFQAQVSVNINLAVLLPDGGRFGVSIVHFNSSEGTFVKVQNHLFYDSNTRPANINNVTVAQKYANSFKYLSGIRYYSLGDSFSVGVYGLDNVNSNSYPQPVVIAKCDDYGIPDFQATGNDLQNWTPQWDSQGSYFEGVFSINKENIYFVGEASITVAVMDWGIAKSVTSAPQKLMINTYSQTSTPLIENFEDEYYRQKEDFNSGFPYGNWLPDIPLVQGEAMVFGGQLIAPATAFSIDHHSPAITIPTWYDYLPLNDSGNPNPDYSLLTCPINYYRTFLDPDPVKEVMNYQIYIDGTFVNGNVNADVEAGLIEIYLRRVASNMTTNVGPTATPMTVQGIGFSFDFDDGVTNGCVRLGSSFGRMLACNTGGLDLQGGVHFHLRILDPAIKIDSIQLEFN